MANYINHWESHGHTKGGWSPTYTSYQSMLARCFNPNNPYYGGRGINVVAHWMTFENFLADMGERPEGTTLDRIDNEDDYGPGNCRWATYAEQRRNQRKRPGELAGCSMPECPKPHHGQGLCVIHYRRWKKYGDPTVTGPSRWGPSTR